MNKLITVLMLIGLSIILISCNSSTNFKIKKGQVGPITSETTVKELSEIFKKDSIVKVLSEGAKGDNYFQDDDEYQIFEKGGKHLLTLVPKEQLDSTSTIKRIQIYDKRYTTEKGLNIGSTFQEINMNNTISNVETSFSSATLFIDELNATVAIDKTELGLKNTDMGKISLEQIPDLAKIKSFIIWFN